MKENSIALKTDFELIEAFKNDDETAFTLLVSRHKEKAVQLAYMSIGNYEDAKDVSQDAFVKAYGALKKFQMKAKFSTWFYRILMNTVKDYMRKKKWQKFLFWKEQAEMDSFLESVEDHHSPVGSSASTKELGIQIEQLIRSLPEKQRWVLTLRFIEGLSLEEITQVTHQSLGTVKATLHTAIKKFRSGMHPYLEGGVTS